MGHKSAAAAKILRPAKPPAKCGPGRACRTARFPAGRTFSAGASGSPLPHAPCRRPSGKPPSAAGLLLGTPAVRQALRLPLHGSAFCFCRHGQRVSGSPCHSAESFSRGRFFFGASPLRRRREQARRCTARTAGAKAAFSAHVPALPAAGSARGKGRIFPHSKTCAPARQAPPFRSACSVSVFGRLYI